MDSPPGRHAELTQITRAYAAATGSFVVVTGEAGIGKTLLAQTAATMAAATGRLVLRGYCVDNVGAPALWPWLRAAREHPALAAALTSETGDDAARFRVAQAVRDVLADLVADDGLLIVIEDLHWADSASIELLTLLLPELDSLRVVVVGTARTSGVDQLRPFDQTLPSILHTDNVIHLPLVGLQAAPVAEWLTAQGFAAWRPRAEALVAATGGNPFYIGCLVRELTPDADLRADLAGRPTLLRTLTSGLTGLSEPVRRTVGTAAVLGERLSPALLASALHLPVTTISGHLADAVGVGLLHFGPTGLAFRHALVRDAVLAATPIGLRSDAHASVAQALEDTGERMLSGAVATHWSQVSGPDAASRCRIAARRAADEYNALSPEQAADFASLAVESGRRAGVDDATYAEDLLLLARNSWSAGRVDDTLRICARGQDAAVAAARDDLLADFALVPQGVGSLEVSHLVAPMCARALAVTGVEQPSRRARLLALAAVCAVEEQLIPADAPVPDAGAAYPNADAMARTAVELAESAGDVQAELEVLAARHLVLSHPLAVTEREHLAARAVELAPQAGTSMGELWGHLWQIDIAFQRGEYDRAETAIAAIDGVAERRGSPVARWHSARSRAALQTVRGDFVGGRAAGDASVDLARRMGNIAMVGQYYAYRQHLATLRGDPDELPADAEDMLRSAPPIALVRISLPLVLVTRGELARARTTFAPLRRWSRNLPVGPRWAGSLYLMGTVAMALDDSDVVRDCYRSATPLAALCTADGGGSPYTSGSFELFLGDLAAALDDPHAVGHYERAIARDDQIGARPFAALARLGLAQQLIDVDRGRSRALAARAAAEFTELDMPGPLARVRGLAGSAPDLPSGERLTDRELQIARLVGQARTNREIADELFLSVRTVESHVRNVLRKVGVTTRTELAVWVGTKEQ